LNAERWQMLLLTVGLLGVGAVAWSLHIRSELAPDTRELATLPYELESWQSVDLPLEETVERMLVADFNLQRRYVHPLGDVIWLYVGYYGTRRGGRPEHTPWECYPSSGWRILAGEKLLVDPQSGRETNEIVVERNGETRLVHFWYRSSRSTGLLDFLDQSVDRLVNRMTAGRADGSLVRISTPFSPGEELAARARLADFSRPLERAIARRWPIELAAPAS